MSLDTTTDVRLEVMRTLVETAVMPDAAQVAAALQRPKDEVVAAFRALHDSHAVVLEPGHNDRLRMANPFSAVPTAFMLRSGDRRWWGNCIWDALGIAAVLGGESGVFTTCADCGVPLSLMISGGRVYGEGIVQFGVPARAWWNDIIYT